MGSLKTYNDMSIYNTYTKLSEEWKSIKSSQNYALSQFKVFENWSDYISVTQTYSTAVGPMTNEVHITFYPDVSPCFMRPYVKYYNSAYQEFTPGGYSGLMTTPYMLVSSNGQFTYHKDFNKDSIFFSENWNDYPTQFYVKFGVIATCKGIFKTS